MTLYVVGLGSNLGDRIGTLRGALSRIRERFTVIQVSSVYETAAVGGPEQPAYLNAATAIESLMEPHALLDELLAIEASFGRIRRERWGARTLDLDLLWMEPGAVASERLTVPHPRLHERRFAVVPLMEVAPHATRPDGLPYAIPPGAVELYGEQL